MTKASATSAADVKFLKFKGDNMKKAIAIILLTVASQALAGKLELGLGTGVNNSYEAHGTKVEGDSDQYSLGYEHSFGQNLSGAMTLGLADFKNLTDKSVKLSPRLYYGNLYASVGLGYHRIDGEDSLTGLIGMGFRTNSDREGKMGYGIRLTQENGLGRRKISQLNLDLVLSTAI